MFFTNGTLNQKNKTQGAFLVKNKYRKRRKKDLTQAFVFRDLFFNNGHCPARFFQARVRKERRCLLVLNFKDVKLFHVKLRIGINNNLFADISLEIGDQ